MKFSIEQFIGIESRYNVSGRYYHTFQHIKDMFAMAKARNIKLTEAQEIAILFHDVVYVAGRDDNEFESVLVMREFLDDWQGKDNELYKDVVFMINRTKHSVNNYAKDKIEAYDHDSKIIVDLDLAIWGSGPITYSKYVRKIRMEYDHLPDKNWLYGRQQFMERFIDFNSIYNSLDRIYLTEEFADLESQAIVNIKEELSNIDFKIKNFSVIENFNKIE